MAKRYSSRNSNRGSSSPRTSPSEANPKENRILCQHFTRALYQVAKDDKFLLILFLGKSNMNPIEKKKKDNKEYYRLLAQLSIPMWSQRIFRRAHEETQHPH